LTNPTITYGHGYLTDCDSATGWIEDASPTLTSTSLTVLYGDVFKITGTASAAAQKTYWEYDITNISTDVYSKFLLRYKTQEAAVGLGAKVELVFTSGTQIILNTTFNTLLSKASGTITSGKTLDKIRFYAVSDAACTAKSVYYDFLLIHKGTFTFPNVAHGLEFHPPPRYAVIPIPSRIGDITQNLGSESATVTASCDLDIGKLSTTSSSITASDWKRPQGQSTKTDYIDGEVFLDIAHNSHTEPWQWLDTGTEQFKVTLETPAFRRTITGNSATHILDLLSREYRLSDARNETYIERFGLNL